MPKIYARRAHRKLSFIRLKGNFMKKIDLSGSWQGACPQKNLHFNATVPGCAHTDLAAAGLVEENFFWRDNALKLRWIEQEDFTYTKTFTVEKVLPGAVLVFECLDTYAEVYLNGKLAGRAENMFIPHRFEVQQLLKSGENRLEVYFHSAVERTKGCKERSHAFTGERLYTRRIQCTYGWDWTERFVTCGISGPCYIAFENAPAAQSVYIYTAQVDSFGAEMVCDIQFKNLTEGVLYTLTVTDPNGKTVYQKQRYTEEPEQREVFCLAKPQLWEPNGTGSQPLYRLTVTVGQEKLCEQFGVRTVRILQLPDEKGSPAEALCKALQQTESGKEGDFNTEFSCFTLLVNGKRVFCKGADWAPCEPLITQITPQKITRLLELAAAAGVNMLRVWGGGFFESQHFYNECDRLGILVTQDFLMACGNYPEDEPWFIAQLTAEAEHAALLLRNHPCLVWWTGDNENAVNGNDTMPEYPGRTAALKAIAPVLHRLDPMRRFLPSSPYGGNRYCSKTAGTTHNTNFLGPIFKMMEQGDLQHYRELYRQYTARFIAEEPTMGAVSTPSLLRMMTEQDAFLEEEQWHYHTQNNPCLARHLLDYTYTFAERLLGAFKNGEDKCFKLQFLQYEWIRLSFELARRNLWFCSGILYWMLADCWPAAAGWSLLDYYCLPKASYYSFKRCAKALTASFDENGGALTLFLTNDGESEQQAEVSLMLVSLESQKTQQMLCSPVCVAAQSVLQLPVKATVEPGQVLVCNLAGNGNSDRTFYKAGNLQIQPTNAVQITAQSSGSVTVTASAYVHAVRLEGGFVFSDNYFSLLPGESKTVTLSEVPEFAAEPLTLTGYTLAY